MINPDLNEVMLPENSRLKGYSGYNLSTLDQQPMLLDPTNYPPPPPPPAFGHTMKHGLPHKKRKLQRGLPIYEESPNYNMDMPSTLNGFTTLPAGFHHSSQSQMSHLLMLQPDEDDEEGDEMRVMEANPPSEMRSKGSEIEDEIDGGRMEIEEAQ
jgi:hypothetical protein